MKKVLIVVFTFVVGFGIGAYVWSFTTAITEQRSQLDRYLHQAVRELLKQQPAERRDYLSGTPIFDRVSEIANLSNDRVQYFYFSPSSSGAELLGINSASGSMEEIFDFNGFYVALSPDGNLVDFGFHKP